MGPAGNMESHNMRVTRRREDNSGRLSGGSRRLAKTMLKTAGPEPGASASPPSTTTTTTAEPSGSEHRNSNSNNNNRALRQRAPQKHQQQQSPPAASTATTTALTVLSRRPRAISLMTSWQRRSQHQRPYHSGGVSVIPLYFPC